METEQIMGNKTCLECNEEFYNEIDNECPKCGNGKINKEDDLILLVWDGKRGQHHQLILNKSLQQPKKGVVYLHQGMRMQKTLEEELKGGAD